MAEDVGLALAWDWEYDRDFVSLMEAACAARAVGFRALGAGEAAAATSALERGALRVGTFLDRAAPDEEPFAALARMMRASGTRILNSPEAVRSAADKATMHLEFLSHGIAVPYTIIISPFSRERQVELSLEQLARLGRPFIIKPANTTGGGTGVITGAETLKDVIDSRKRHQDDKYLLQEKVIPAQVAGRRGWFRVFFVCGTVIPCWWDDTTHLYAELECESAGEYALAPLRTMTAAIGGVCGLDFFSTEIALTAEGKFVTVDYVNEICDMRLQSRHPDGVPDGVARAIAGILAATAPSAGQ